MRLKKLFVIRHAKSSWALPHQTDFSRPLNDRGMRDAPVMAQRLLVKQKSIDLFLSSTALRARQTCEAFCTTYNYPHSSIQFEDKLYHAPAERFYEVVENVANSINSLAVFSHNPGITDFVNSLGTRVRIDNMPTCGIYAVEVDINDWCDFNEAEKRYVFFDYPKKG